MTTNYSIIDYMDLRQGLDFDPEHYHPDRLDAWIRLSRNSEKTIGDYFYEVVEIHDPDTESESFDLTDALGYFLTGEGKKGWLSAKKVAQKNDILISRLRSYLKEICIVPQRKSEFMPYISTEFLVFRPKQGNGGWLLPYLLCDKVQTILKWSQTGNNHPRFRSSSVLEMPIPKDVLALREKLSVLVDNAMRIYESGLYVYPEAEAELLERIGWQELDKKPCELYYIEDAENLSKRGRMDTEHYRPKYKCLCKRLLQIGSTPIDKLCFFNKHGIQPPYIIGGTVPIITQRQFTSTGLSLSEVEHWTDLEFLQANPDFVLRKGDVLVYCVSAGDFLGQTNLFDSDKPAVAASFVTILRTNELVPGYLALFLNSPAGLLQSNCLKRGTSPFYLYPRDLAKILVFIPKNKTGKIDIGWQEKLSEKVLKATRAKEEARSKLEEAKRLIEEAIKK